MKIIDLPSPGDTVTNYESHGVSAAMDLTGQGVVRVHSLSFAAESQIGPHPTGYAQLFVVLSGSGWVAGADHVRTAVGIGQAAFFEKGELHSKGSAAGMTVVMLQVSELTLAEGR